MTRLCTLLLSLVALCALGSTAQAQTPLRIYVDAIPFPNLSQAKTLQDVFEGRVFVGYRLGVGLDANVGKMMYVGTGLSLAMKGNQYTVLDLMGKSGDIKIYSHYIQIPINVGVRLNVTPRIGCSMEVGPYFVYVLGATASQGKILDDIQKTYNVHKDGIPGMDSTKFKRYDIGLGAKAKVTFGSWYGMLGADLGFVDELKLEKNDPKIEKLGQKAMRNISFYLGAGFTLWVPMRNYNTLIIVAHPDLEHSVINKAWAEASTGHATIHSLCDVYPTGVPTDMAYGCALAERHDCVILQFPPCWYSAPAILKQRTGEVSGEG